MRADDLPDLPAIVQGRVSHARSVGVSSSFEHRTYLWLVDLDDLPDHGVLGRFDAADHLGAPTASIRDNLEAYLAAQGVSSSPSRVVMLAGARVAGYVFDPLTVYWCFGADGSLQHVVAEVHNTYGERDAYLLHPDERGRDEVDKHFYVSPFFDTSGRYRMQLALDSRHVAVSIDLHHDDGAPVFRASFAGTPARATRAAVREVSWRQPFMPQRVSALIHMHGIALWLRRLPVLPRPEHSPVAGVEVGRDRPWDAVPSPPRAPLRARAARYLAAQACRRAGVDLLVGAGPAGGDGRASGEPAPARPTIVARPAAFARLGASPKVGLAEAYIAGDWDVTPGTDLAAALRPFAARLTSLLPGWAWRLRRLTDVPHPSLTRNHRGGSRRNIEAHYDLSNDLFERFLDETLSYSSALFEDLAHPEPLERAQLRKIDAVLDLAGVGEGTRVLEIGSGWGSLAIRAAQRGAHVVSVTLSPAQLDLARRRVDEAGMGGRVELRLEDYRDVTGEFDAVVSVEMIEAVGEEYWGEFVRVLHDRLVPGGRGAVQAITMSDERMLATRHSHGWIQQYIFPGGLIPSVAALQREATAHGGLTITSARRFGSHYALTLRLWRERLESEWPAITALGFSTRFRRMWRLYLAYCEAGFDVGYLDVEHLLVERSTA